MKKILVPVDGSEISIRALEVAKTLAQAFGSQIVLISVSGEGLSSEYIGGYDLQKLIDESKVYAEKNLTQAKATLGDLAAKSETIVKTGDPANEILDYLDGSDVDFVVIGSQGLGYSAARRLFVGSVANKVLHGAKQPVLIVK